MLRNTLGDITFSRDSQGAYKATSSGLFTVDKTIYEVKVPEQVLGDGFNSAIGINGTTALSANNLPFITYQNTTDNVVDG